MRAAHYPGRAPIEAYGNGGFRFADMSHRGSILCLPSGIHGWMAAAGDPLTEDRFARVLGEAEDIEILLIGAGPVPQKLPDRLRAALTATGMAVEAMATGPAVRTYNVLLAEDRRVAAALIAVD